MNMAFKYFANDGKKRNRTKVRGRGGGVSFGNGDDVRTFPIRREGTRLKREIEDTSKNRSNRIGGRFEHTRGNAIGARGSVRG